MAYYVLAWHEGKFAIYNLGGYDRPEEYKGVVCQTKFEFESEAQEVINWILRVLGTEALGRLGA